MRALNILAISALVLSGPILLSEVSFDTFGESGSAFAKGKKPKSKPDRSRARPKPEKPAHAGGPRRSALATHLTGRAGDTTGDVPRERNIHAQLRSLNSLNRNINGLMNSSDPKMDGFREFVLASADLEGANVALDAAQGLYDGAASSYTALLDGLSLELPQSEQGYLDLANALSAIANQTAPDQGDFLLEDSATPDTAAFDAAFSTWQTSTQTAGQALQDLGAVEAAWTELNSALDGVTAASEGASEDVMIAAMVSGLNATGGNGLTAEDMSPEMIEWVASQLGVADADGLIDAYLAAAVDEDDMDEDDPSGGDDADETPDVDG